ncbi:hypothetical protein [Methanobrevibacter boviskoreani]|uniref:hypothetical protein n=1 Tax=Methanobrevibacter boviskoreani TaxID=1348249 RepID=UPI0023F12773|nr:hypothetical protein [Methanobrevibacter boviskoreani]MDD6256527.1 hypothetical protein [Methanobrevibacter boviskoreani]
MTIAIAMKINDGVVLATDSSSTILGLPDENGSYEVHHTYFTADKLFNLKKGSPIGAMTWGNGSINNESISTLVKDFRKQIKEEEYTTVKDVVNRFQNFLDKKINDNTTLGFLIAGYSKGEGHPEMYFINIEKGKIIKNEEINKNDPLAISWFGETMFLSRFLLGYDENIFEIMKENNISNENINNIIDECKNKLQLPLGVPAMPIQDAIDLVKFLAGVSVNSSRFIAGPQTIGGPIDIAVITKHEGFKWIQRKHYYDMDLNLTTGGDVR